jgi:hypothetical protein
VTAPFSSINEVDTMTITDEFCLRKGTEDDLDVLSSLNKRLNDEFYPEVGMTEGQLKTRIDDLIKTDHDAYVFEQGGRTVGYALVLHGSNPLDIRQFYMGQEARGRGYNNLAVLLLKEATKTNSIEADALVWKAAVGSM